MAHVVWVGAKRCGYIWFWAFTHLRLRNIAELSDSHLRGIRVWRPPGAVFCLQLIDQFWLVQNRIGLVEQILTSHLVVSGCCIIHGCSIRSLGENIISFLLLVFGAQAPARSGAVLSRPAVKTLSVVWLAPNVYGCGHFSRAWHNSGVGHCYSVLNSFPVSYWTQITRVCFKCLDSLHLRPTIQIIFLFWRLKLLHFFQLFQRSLLRFFRSYILTLLFGILLFLIDLLVLCIDFFVNSNQVTLIKKLLGE